ncbi:copper amine oxidase N-terminal domain-containing protein [Moorella sp. E306M]|uniref:copper amine oxidase N-terminal domain-containing protein n=1 Tax=Moorella sp. E306M TaxID=2572683 RepID=UPI0010FFB16B|nr:copper amine oxidase N-terminal domain-containing protein [Moorella sp. E306M]GEA18341.1 copper amine oxidase-like protein [Moorella sp. E306M]
MLKTRKKWISILLTLAMLVGLMVPFAGTAAADTTYTDFSSGYQYVTTGEAKTAGTATATEKDVNTWDANVIDGIYAKVTLPSGVTYNKKPEATSPNLSDYVSVAGSTYTFIDSSDNSFTVYIPNSNFTSNNKEYVTFKFNNPNASLDIESDVSGAIQAEVELTAVQGNSIVWVESGNVTIAKVQSKAVSITAGTPKTVEQGNGKQAADITIQESAPGALSASELVYARIETTDVTFASNPQLTYAYVSGPTTAELTSDKKEAYFQLTGASGVLPGKVVFKSSLNVPPSVSGDIKITIYSKTADSNIDKTTVTVATVGNKSAYIEDLKDNDGTVYAGKTKLLDASFKLKTNDGNDFADNKTIVLELSAGKFNTPPQIDGNNFTLYNDNKSAYYVTANTPDEAKIDHFDIKAAGDVAEGDIVVTVSGTAGASGTAVIGQFKRPLIVTAEKTQINALKNSQPVADIFIKEAGDGVIPTDGDLVVELPEGISFDGTPSVKVTSGNISLGTAYLDGGKLVIPVNNASGIASEIKIYNIKYNVGRLAFDGDVVAKIYGASGSAWNDTKTLATVSNATVVSATARSASFVIGSTTYTVNGTQYTMDVAAYVKDGRTYLPVRYVAYALGVNPENIFWDEATQTVTVLKGTTAVQLTVGSKVLKVNGISLTMDVAPEVVSGRTMLPFRFIAQALGASVGYDDATQTVTMNLQ